MNILVIGQCTLHWGRMEFGNIGNYYIIEPFVRELHRVFPGARIRTTMQFSERFQYSERIECLPMSYYYEWSGEDLVNAKRENELAGNLDRATLSGDTSPYLRELLDTDLVIEFSGDIWGDNADLLGADRFEVGLRKARSAQLLGIPTAMLAGSPGPFGHKGLSALAKEVFDGFDLVTNREPLSRTLLDDAGFDLGRTEDFACPAFLFEPRTDELVERTQEEMATVASGRPLVGFILCGWNFEEGPFDRWPRETAEYKVFMEAVAYLVNDCHATVVFMSHSNGFEPGKEPFELKRGRDYPIARQLFEIASSEMPSASLHCLDGVYDPAQTKAIISGFDMLVSGRVHAAVAGISQHVPTVIIDYGHEPKAHKLRGFAEVAGVSDFVADPSVSLIPSIGACFYDRAEIRRKLEHRMPAVRELAKKNFEKLKGLFES
jgi:colanic acid/amylovoran biosynthesis protein